MSTSRQPPPKAPLEWAQLCRRAAPVVQRYRAHGWTLSCAESCTGGLVCAALTSVADASQVFAQGFVTYSNEAKRGLLGVDPDILCTHGAVSAPVAIAMAQGARRRAGAHASIAVTGIAGPTGATADKPVGLVHLCAATQARTLHREMRFGALGREQVRFRSVQTALALLAVI